MRRFPWKKIHENSEKFIYNILSEVPYSDDIIKIISDKLEDNVSIKSIFLTVDPVKLTLIRFEASSSPLNLARSKSEFLISSSKK